MTRERYQEPQAGGTKKFLYSGPVSRRRGPQFDDDIDDREWNFQPTVTTSITDDDHHSTDFDLDGVWSIKKNVNIPGINSHKSKAPKPGPNSGWSVNVGTGYYSRHGGLTGGQNGSDSVENGQHPSTGENSWNQQNKHTFSYAQAGPGGKPQAVTSQTPSDLNTNDSHRQGTTNLYRTGGISQGGRYTLQNSNRHNHSRHF